MQSALPPAAATAALPGGAAERKPTLIDLLAGFFLLAAVVLHVVAMVPTYFSGAAGHASLWSQTDQASLYAVLAAGWAATLVVGLMGPARMALCAGAAVGIAATELGFRVVDLGEIIHGGISEAGPGFWLMSAGWVAGALGATFAVLASRRRMPASERSLIHALYSPPVNQRQYPQPVGEDWTIDWPPPPAEIDGPPANLVSAAGTSSPVDVTTEMASLQPGDPTHAVAIPDLTRSTEVLDPTLVAQSGDTGLLDAIPEEDPGGRAAWTLGVGVLAAAMAGAFLMAWDHYYGVAASTGTAKGFNLGYAFDRTLPWEAMAGNAICGAALFLVPVIAIRLRNRAAGAAMAAGCLVVLATQFVSAVIGIDLPVPLAFFGLSQSQAAQIGFESSARLTGWFTVDALVAFALFVAFMAWSTLRVVQENSPTTLPSAPDFRRDSIAWPS
jgi:hypothetical protein